MKQMLRLTRSEIIVIAAILIIAIAVFMLIGCGGMAADSRLEDDPQATVTQQPSDLRQRAGLRRRSVDSPPGSEGLRQLQRIDPDNRAIGRDELDRIRNAALAVGGPGVITEVDRSDDLGEAYEVEVVTHRREVDIALDRNFERVPNLRYDD